MGKIYSCFYHTKVTCSKPLINQSHFCHLYCFNMNTTLNFNGRLPVPRPGQVLGLVGTNGIGKSTALKVLAGKLKPNLGRFNVNLLIPYNIFYQCFLLPSFSVVNTLIIYVQNPPDWQEILTYFRGSELQNYFTRILEDNLKVHFTSQQQS